MATVKELTVEDGNEIRRLYWKDNLTAKQIAEKYKICAGSVFQVAHNVSLYDETWRFPANKKEIREVVNKLAKGGFSLYHIALIVRKLFDVKGKVCINSIRRWTGRITTVELKRGKAQSTSKTTKRKVAE